MSTLPHHLQQESISLNNQLDTIKLKLLSLQKRVQEHQDDTNQPILITKTPVTPDGISSTNPYALANTNTITDKKTEIQILSNKTGADMDSKLKNMHWNPISAERIQQSIWKEIDQDWCDFDAQNFDHQFQASARDKVRFLSNERAEQVRHGLSALDMSNDEIRDIILSVDETRIDLDMIRSLIDIVPTPKEQLQAQQLSQCNEIKQFAVAEQFFHSLCDIKELGLRLKHWLFKLEFDEKMKKLRSSVTSIQKATLSITLSKYLRQIFAIILAFGNYMNSGNLDKQNCSGFSLSDLYLLPTIQTGGPEMVSFPMFLCAFMERKYPKLLDNITKQLKPVNSAAKIDSKKIDGEYYSLVQKVQELQTMIKSYKAKYFGTLDIDDLFITKMALFHRNMKNAMHTLNFRVDSFHKCQAQLVKYFACDTTVTIQEIFKDINNFVQMLHTAKNKLIQQNINVRDLFNTQTKGSRTSNIYVGLFGKQSGTNSPTQCSVKEREISPGKDTSNNINFNLKRRNTLELRLTLDAETESNCSETKTPIIRHKAIEAKLNRFLSKTPQVSKFYARPYKTVAKNISDTNEQSGNESQNNNYTDTYTPLMSKSYVNPYKNIVNHYSRIIEE